MPATANSINLSKGLNEQLVKNKPDQDLQPIVMRLKQGWQELGYRNTLAEWSLYALFLSGLLLWDVFSLPWQGIRWLLISHLLLSIIVFPIYVLPFWLSHRRLLKKSNKRLLNVTGQILDILLSVCVLSGLYLLIQGNRGGELDFLIFLAHLISAIILFPVLMRHSYKWSVLQPIWSLVKKIPSLFNANRVSQ
jgi:hypothetical protein